MPRDLRWSTCVACLLAGICTIGGSVPSVALGAEPRGATEFAAKVPPKVIVQNTCTFTQAAEWGDLYVLVVLRYREVVLSPGRPDFVMEDRPKMLSITCTTGPGGVPDPGKTCSGAMVNVSGLEAGLPFNSAADVMPFPDSFTNFKVVERQRNLFVLHSDVRIGPKQGADTKTISVNLDDGRVTYKSRRGAGATVWEVHAEAYCTPELRKVGKNP